MVFMPAVPAVDPLYPETPVLPTVTSATTVRQFPRITAADMYAPRAVRQAEAMLTEHAVPAVARWCVITAPHPVPVPMPTVSMAASTRTHFLHAYTSTIIPAVLRIVLIVPLSSVSALVTSIIPGITTMATMCRTSLTDTL